jgi:protein ImuB
MGTRIEDCSCPREAHWRPGARWARREDALPPHQRTPMRELGRRTEPAAVPFRRFGSSPGRGGGPPPKAVVEGAFHLAQPPLHQPAADPLARPGEDNPLITVHRVGNRIEIAAASPEAQTLGLTPGMPLTQARVLVPNLDIRDAEPEADAALLTRLALFAARRWTPRPAFSGTDGLWLDLDGVAHLFGGEERMCRRIRLFCARLGYTARIAVAGTPGAAHALARFGSEPLILCRSGAEAEALAPLPLSALRVEEGTLAAARRLGLETVGELFSMPRGPLQRRFGQAFLTRLDQAVGRAAEPFDPIVPEEPPSAALRFAEPIATPEAIEEALGELMARLVHTLEKAGLAARVFTLLCERVDRAEQRLRIGTARPTRDAGHLLRLLKMKIETIEPGFGLDAMRLVAGRCEPLGPEQLSGEKAPPGLASLVDRLATRLGLRRVFRTSAIESDLPERSVRRIGPLAIPEAWPRWPRPVRLLSPPEPIEQVMAELPDQPPVRFSWRGKLHRVRRADGPERLYGEWWRSFREAEAVRDYFQVEDEEGARFWLFRRGDGEDTRTGDLSWYLHGVFG